MSSSRSILFVSSEVTPFVKTGGLADVSAALPLGLMEAGHDVRIITPKYGHVSERRNRIHEIKRLKDIPVEIGGEEKMATVKSSQVVNSRAKVQVYLVCSDDYFEPNKGIYANVKTGKEFKNNGERFLFFAKSAIETCFRLGWRPDIIHCNDWQTAMIPAMLKEIYSRDDFFEGTKSVLTIHNMSYQGIFDKSVFDASGLPEKVFSDKGAAQDDKLNMLKAGIVYADEVVTVSPSYAKEITTSEHGCGLEETLKKQKKKLHGILNGVDNEVWNPEVDKMIEENYTDEDLEEKFENKEELADEFGFEADPEVPILVMIARMVEQKGYDLVIDALPEFAKRNLHLLIMGDDGGQKYAARLEKEAAKHENVSVKVGYDEKIAHLMQAGADMLLMPSKFEPCGLNQLYALAYGTVPIVHATGGLKDSISPYKAGKNSGNGFVFKDYSVKGMMAAVDAAVKLFEKDEEWEELQKRIMKEDHTWKASAEQYVEDVYG